MGSPWRRIGRYVLERGFDMPPLMLTPDELEAAVYAETVRLLAAWCELRSTFRHFRTDRILAAEFRDECHGASPGGLRARWRRHFEAERGVRLP